MVEMAIFFAHTARLVPAARLLEKPLLLVLPFVIPGLHSSDIRTHFSFSNSSRICFSTAAGKRNNKSATWL